MTNRQKELTIKHLELQIQKLLRENEEMELKLEAVKAEICAKCETKLLLRENSENKCISKSYKPPTAKVSSVLFEKKTSHSLCPNRLKSLERIIEHKDKRIMHLSKEVQRLTKAEKDLTQKIYRLTKLLPMSRMPSDTLTDCLLQEIQMLESQKQSNSDLLNEDLFMSKSKSANYSSVGRVGIKSDRFKKPAGSSNIQKSAASMPRRDEVDMSKAENEVLFRKLQKLCNDVNELKRLFTFESEKLSSGLSSTAKEYTQVKMQLEDIINNLNEVVQNILSNNFYKMQSGSASTNLPAESDDKYVISCLQERLKESLGIVTEYENENKVLNEDLNQLKKQLADKEKFTDGRIFRSPVGSNKAEDMNDVRKLKEVIKIRESQLEAAESHINTCQKFIQELQKTYKHLNIDNFKIQSTSSPTCDERSAKSCELQNKALQTKLEVAEKNIKTCETVIEQMQNTIKRLEEINEKLETELHMAKSQKISVVNDPKSRGSGSSQTSIHKKLNVDLMERVKILEGVNSKLEADLQMFENRNLALEAAEQEKALLKAQLETSERNISTLSESVETLQVKLKTAEHKNSALETEIMNLNHANNMLETYENDVMALKNDLILKEEENGELKESLYTLESKTLEMNHYRKSLHLEIEKLCKALMENDDSDEDSSRRKAIYKAAVLHSAQALLRLDDNFNLKPEDDDRNSALEEMKHQIEVYLTEVSRIHELVTIKEQQRDELLREYLEPNDFDILRPSSSLQHETHLQGQPAEKNLQSSPTLHNINSMETDVPSTNSMKSKSVKLSTETSHELKMLQEEITATKSVTTYLLTSCTRLEDLLTKEKMERGKCERELEVQQEMIKDLKVQLSTKNNMVKRINSLIELMRSKECNDEISLEQLKSEIKWLVDENQKIFERVSSTQTELCRCKEENSRFQNDLDSLKRQLLNEKYEHAKVNNELKHLRIQISHSQSSLNTT